MDQLISRTERLPDSALLWGRQGWGMDRELLAQAVELLQAMVIGIARLNGVPRTKLPRFHPIPRPGERRRKVSAAGKLRALRAMIGGRS